MVKNHTNTLMMPLMTVLAVGIWSAIHPYDVLTWVLEAAPVLLIFVVMVASYRRFQFTALSYWLLALGAILVLIGAHYTYARMPVFAWLQEVLVLERNHYDRFGHFFQGVVPAIIFRELLLRTSPLKPSVWLFIIVTALCMAKSVLYEFAEWWTVIILDEDAHDFLAMQGDEWDAQKDIFWATIGALLALLTLAPWHDRQLARLENQR